MITAKRRFGDVGENVATEYLQNLGYKLLSATGRRDINGLGDYAFGLEAKKRLLDQESKIKNHKKLSIS